MNPLEQFVMNILLGWLTVNVVILLAIKIGEHEIKFNGKNVRILRRSVKVIINYVISKIRKAAAK